MSTDGTTSPIATAVAAAVRVAELTDRIAALAQQLEPVVDLEEPPTGSADVDGVRAP